MIRRSLLVAFALVALAAPSFAKEVKGLYGLGYVRPEAPVGGRLWATDKVGFDLGIGFSSSDESGDTRSSFTLDAGVPLVVANAGDANFFVRPGLTYAQSPLPVGGVNPDPDNKLTQLWVSGTLGVEYFFTDNFSIQAAHGVVYKSIDPDKAGDSYTELASEAFGLSSIGFHYYFGR